MKMQKLFACFVLACLPGALAWAGDPEPVVLGQDSHLLAGIPGKGPLTVAEIQQWLAQEQNHRPLEITLPSVIRGALANAHLPSDNPLTRAKIELGRQLYFDPRLSADSKVSCASCHLPDEAYAAHTQFGVGINGQEGNRNSPVAYNRLFSKSQFWDGRAESLEAQAVGPIENPIEMGNTHATCVSSLRDIEVYRLQFERIFEDGLNIDNVGKAIACFERALVTGPTPYDYQQSLLKFEESFADLLEFIEDEPELNQKYQQLKRDVKVNSMSESALRGMKLFSVKGKCEACHIGFNLTDELYHNLGVGMDAKEPDLGRFVVTGKEEDRGAFKTPTLRNIMYSAPYMHDGSQKTLEEVVDWYDRGGHPNQWLSGKIGKLNLTEAEKKDLVNFMKEGLTGSFPEVQSGRLPE